MKINKGHVLTIQLDSIHPCTQSTVVIVDDPSSTISTKNGVSVSILCTSFITMIIASGLQDGSIVVWKPLEEDEMKQKRILKCSKSVHSLLFSPDGRLLASSNEKGEIIIWSMEVRMHDVIAKCIQSMETVAINGFLVDY